MKDESLKKIHISYYDENDVLLSHIAYLENISEGLVTFRTRTNIFRIPVSRILKIKEKGLEEGLE